MLSENRAERNQMEMFCIDSFVPEDHLLRKINEAVDSGYKIPYPAKLIIDSRFICTASASSAARLTAV